MTGTSVDRFCLEKSAGIVESKSNDADLSGRASAFANVVLAGCSGKDFLEEKSMVLVEAEMESA